MKIKLLFLAGCSLLAAKMSVAQSPAAHTCPSEKYSRELTAQVSGFQANQAATEQQIQDYISQQQNQRQAGVVLKIPVVIHVVTENGCDGISKAQILNGLEVLNKDFRRQNADTVNTRAIFKPVAADTEIEFVLAKKNPLGSQTEGIVRVTSPTAKGSYNRDDVKAASPAWPTDKYFNIWLVENIYDAQAGANILGYAQMPQIPQLNTYGVVLVHTAWGKQGAVPGSTANTNGHYATHEISHCLNLYHISDGSIVNGVPQCMDPNGNCSFGDGVLDTPPSLPPTMVTTTCDFNLNTCHNDVTCSSFSTDVPDMIENFLFLSDDNCQNMFTKGQRDRMHQALTFYPHLQNLVSLNNAVFTGIDPNTVLTTGVPMPYFCANKRVCAGGSITFTDKTYNAAATVYDWTFAGGTPATSSAPNPVVTYNTPGKYSLTFQVTNPEGTRMITLPDYITVVPTSNLINVSPANFYVESFEEASFPVSATSNRTWEKATSSLAANPDSWTRVSNAFSNISGSGGTNSLRLQNANLPAGTVSTLITPNFAIQGGIPGAVFMEMAYAKRTAPPAEILKVFYSHDCGATWSGPIKTLTGNQLITNGGTQVSNFVPTAAEWRMEGIVNPNDLGTVFGNTPHVMFKIEVTSNGGGNLYIDNFSIGTVLGTNEALSANQIQLFPNPLTAETGITFNLKKAAKGSLKIYDLVGNAIYSGPETTFAAGKHTVLLAGKLKDQSAGMYLVQLNLEGKSYHTKLLIQ